MNPWSVEDADDLYRISQWGDGYFGINQDGNLMVLPMQNNPDVHICIQEVVDELRQKGVQFPAVLRFHDILRHRVQRLNTAFAQTIQEQDYKGAYRGVYPIKVNQMREVVDEIVDTGAAFHYGLESGSKAELMAVLAYTVSEEALTICNGYKDEEFLRLALLGSKIGRKMVVVVEKYSEIGLLLKLSQEMDVRPIIGLRVKMRIKTEGRWSASSGERAKFGLSISELLKAVQDIEAAGYQDCVQLLHFHVGSQLSDIRYVREAVEEASRIYARLVKRGIPLVYLDIGGGLAVDYDGSHSRTHSSMNYNLNEYAANVVASVKQICDFEGVQHPNLVSESGRAITAHHSCVIMQVIGEIAPHTNPVDTAAAAGEHFLITNLRHQLDDLIERENYRDAFNQAGKTLEDVLSGFKLGVISLEEFAKAETLYWTIMARVQEHALAADDHTDDMIELGDLLASQYLCNFSLFQSAADSWAISQILPVAPLTRLNEEPDRQCSLADITCDSDGKISAFISEGGEKSTLPLHRLRPNEPYFIGLFMTGAYQDVMGDMHNLFGRLSEAHVFCDDNDPSDFYIEEFVQGSSASQVLQTMQYNPAAMADTVKAKIDGEVKKGTIRSRDGVQLTDFYENCLLGYTYLRP